MADLRLKPLHLSGWGRVSEVETLAARPERLADLRRQMGEAGTVLAYGLGRSYGDAPLVANNGRTILMTRLNRLISFDEATGELVAEAGVSFDELQRIFLPRGWIVPVSPGTAFVTLGGAIANDVHGKNHPLAGSLSRHIDWCDLLLPSGEEKRVSRSENSDIFYATLGGIGLTGIIVRAAMRLQKVPGAMMQVVRMRTKNLEDTFAAFAATSDEDPYAVAWMDVLAQGPLLGRGIFEKARPAAGAWQDPPAVLPMPIDLPPFVMNPFSISMFNKLRYNLFGPSEPTGHLISTARFLYPLDRIKDWNRMYGKRGFRQFQAVIPTANAEKGIRKLLESIAGSRQGSFLAVLKKMGETGEGYLSFPMPGYTLALDFPNNEGLGELLAHLEKVTLEHGGRIYLAKDSALSPTAFRAMYPRLGEFRRVLSRIDPTGRMDSVMARRLKIREGA